MPRFIQLAYATPQGNKASVPVKLTGAQRAGNFNVVVIGWSDTSSNVTTVTDTSGNTYARAIGPTRNTSAGLSHSIYYAAKNSDDPKIKAVLYD